MPGMSPHMKIKKGRPLDNWPGGNTPPVIDIQVGFNANPDTAIPDNSFVAIATDAQQGDISAQVVWNLLSVRGSPATAGVQNVDVGAPEGGGSTGLLADTAGSQVVDLGGPPAGGASSGLLADTAGDATALIAGSPAGTVVPGVATQTWYVDVTFNIGGLQQLAVAVNVADDYTDIAALLDTQVTNGTVTFSVGGEFVATSDSVGNSSTAIIAAGTGGGGGIDLFAAITAAAGGNPAITFPAPTDGTRTVYTATVDVDGAEAAQAISIIGEFAQTFDDLITELDADTTGASWLIGGVGLVCTSDSTGIASAVLLADTDLFSTLTGFSSILGGVPGTTTLYTATIEVDENGPTAISIAGEDAQIFSDLVDELNAIAGPAGANWSLGVAASLQAQSDTAGDGSTIQLADTNLFSSLTGFNGIDAAVDGVDEVVDATVQGGVGGNPTLNFTVLGVQDVEASITDGFGATTVDTESVDVVSV